MASEQEQVVEAADGELPGIEPERVEWWLRDNAPAVELPVEFALIAAGGSNLTYRVIDAAERRFILRRPPVGKLLASAHDMTREYRIMAALGGSPVPVPEMVALCEDEAVLGAPFYVMEYVQGVILRDEAGGVAVGPDGARWASTAFVDALAAIHTLDPASVGLDSLSRPGGYVERQLRRWYSQYQQTAGDEPDPMVADLHDRLAANVPTEGPSRAGRLLHGDYHIDNLVFDGQFRAVAVLDWELCALGDPLADLAWALMFWTTTPGQFSIQSSPPTLAPGFLSTEEFIERYGESSALGLDDLPFFLTFSHWKMACLMQGAVFRRNADQGGGMSAAAGDRIDPRERVRQLVAAASDLAGRAGI